MARLNALALAAASSLAFACSSSSPAPAPTDGTGSSTSSVSFEMQAHVPAGSETFKCQFVQLPDAAGFMVGGSHQYTPGSHHMLLFTTDLQSIPAGGDQVQNCYEGGGSFMSHVRGLLYGAQVPQGTYTMPDGVGLRTTASQVLLFQVHYLNATASDLDATVDVNLTMSDGTGITNSAGIMFFYDPFIDVPAGAKATAQMRCLVPNDVTLFMAASHYHARGSSYAAYLDESADALATTPFYTSTDWEHPASLAAPVAIKGGSHVRFQCGYDNSTGTQEYVQGPSATDNEMCMFIGTYWPDMGQQANYCLAGPDMFGAGSATCKDTIACVQACGKGALGHLFGAPACTQKCVVQSCPKASASLTPLMMCARSSCQSQCGDPASSDCTSCLNASCGAQYDGCQKAACE